MNSLEIIFTYMEYLYHYVAKYHDGQYIITRNGMPIVTTNDEKEWFTKMNEIAPIPKWEPI